MVCSSAKLPAAAAMDISTGKLQVLVLALIISRLTCEAHTVSECCRRSVASCPKSRLYVLLCRSGPLTGDASAGILTLGKRKAADQRFQSRLNQLLHGSRNQAAGILTMGKRTGEAAGQRLVRWLPGTQAPPQPV